MLFLSPQEKHQWTISAQKAINEHMAPRDSDLDIRTNLRPAFRFYVGALLAAGSSEERAMEWFVTGAQEENTSLLLNAFAVSFLKRQRGRFIMPDVAFVDPAPYVHFTGVPTIKSARQNFIRQCGESLPDVAHPLRIIDVGCGDGGLLVDFLKHLLEVRKVGDIGEILLVDASPAMIELARKIVVAAFPRSVIGTIIGKIQDVARQIEGLYDVALMSLCYHHMPWEKKVRHMHELKSKADHFLVFELDANNDLPELHSPELALSVYQSYGRMIDAVFAHDAPLELANACVDRFLMTEAVSILSQPRGIRTDYHMLRTQWHLLFQETLSEDFSCWADSAAYSDDFMSFFTLHYGRQS